MSGIGHVVIGRADSQNFQRADHVDGRWVIAPTKTVFQNYLGPIVKILEGAQRPIDLTISLHRSLDDLIRRQPQHLGLSKTSRRTAVLMPIGGLADDDLCAFLSWVRPGDPLRDSEPFVRSTAHEKIKEILQDRAALLDERGEVLEEIWLRWGWKAETIAPGSFPVPRWRKDEAEGGKDEEPEAAAAASTPPMAGEMPRPGETRQTKAKKSSRKPAA